MPVTLQPRFKIYLVILLVVVALVMVLTAIVVPLGRTWVPDDFRNTPPLTTLLLQEALVLTPTFVFLALVGYAMERNRRWTIDPAAGIGIWNRSTLKRQYSWDEIKSIVVSAYGVRLRLHGRWREENISGVDPAPAMTFFPFEKLRRW